MSAPLRTGTYARWRKIREIFCQVAESSDWTKKHKLKSIELPKKVFVLRRQNDQSLFNDFRSMINLRCSEALRSVLVRCKQDHIGSVLNVLQSQYANVVGAYYYPQSDGQNSLLVEFDKYIQKDVFILNDDELLKRTSRSVDHNILQKVRVYEHKPFQISSLMDCSDVSHQIMCLSNDMQLSKAKIRQQYYVGMFVKKLLQQLYPSASIHFFGSSACGLATDNNSDLDMVILYKDDPQGNSVLNTLHRNMLQKKYKDFTSNLMYIRFARVPIIKFDQDHTGMSCDISCNSLGGIMMAEMLCWLRIFEPLFQPLVMTIKLWAKNHNLVGYGLGGHFSNHMITMLVIAFLQQQGSLPPLKMAYANKEALSSLNHGNLESKWNDVMLKDSRRLIMNFLDEKPDLGSLLHQFFKFYSSFQFDSLVLNILSGTNIRNHHNHNIYMSNPYENQHNMCQNVHAMFVDKFQNACMQSVRILDIHMEKNDVEPWGLMCIMTRGALRKHQQGPLFSIDWVFDNKKKKTDEIIVKISENEDVCYNLKPLNGMIDKNVSADKSNTEGKKLNENIPLMKPLEGEMIAGICVDKPSIEEIKCENNEQSKQPLKGTTDQRIRAEESKKKKKWEKKKSGKRKKSSMKLLKEKVIVGTSVDKPSNEEIKCKNNEQSKQPLEGITDQRIPVDVSKKKKNNKKVKKVERSKKEIREHH